MAAHYYIKLFLETLDDIKMCTLSDRLYRRTIELFLAAGKYKWSNELPPLKKLSWMLRIPEDELLADLVALQEETYIVHEEDGKWYVTNFEARQAASKIGERVQRSRENKRKQQYDGNEVLQNDVTNGYTEYSIVKDIVKERVQNSAASLDNFDGVQTFIEQITGYPVLPTPDNVAAINEMVKMGAIEDDFRDALAYLSDRGKVARGATGLLGCVRTAVLKRTQSKNAKSSTKPYIPEEHASEVY